MLKHEAQEHLRSVHLATVEEIRLSLEMPRCEVHAALRELRVAGLVLRSIDRTGLPVARWSPA